MSQHADIGGLDGQQSGRKGKPIVQSHMNVISIEKWLLCRIHADDCVLNTRYHHCGCIPKYLCHQTWDVISLKYREGAKAARLLFVLSLP